MTKTKTHVKKGDTVTVIAGNHKGARGTVLGVSHTKKGVYVTVEGVRMIKKAVRPAANQEGGLIEKEGPIHISNVKKVD